MFGGWESSKGVLGYDAEVDADGTVNEYLVRRDGLREGTEVSEGVRRRLWGHMIDPGLDEEVVSMNGQCGISKANGHT